MAWKKDYTIGFEIEDSIWRYTVHAPILKRYSIYYLGGNITNGADGIADLIGDALRQPDEPAADHPVYHVTGFTWETSDPLNVKPYFLSEDGLMGVFREEKGDRVPKTTRYAVMLKREGVWSTFAIIRGPWENEIEPVWTAINRICERHFRTNPR